MKRILALLLAVMLILGLAACDQTGDPTPTPTPPASSEESTPAQATPTEEPTPAGWAPEVGEVTEDDKVDSFAEQFRGDTEQGPVWFYLSDDGEEVKELFYTPDWGDNWQFSATPSADDVYYSLFDWEGLRASAGMWAGFNIKTMIAWRAYQDGTVTIGEWNYSAQSNPADEPDVYVAGAVISILKGSEELYTGTTTEDNENIFEGLEVEVSEGDIIFIVFEGSQAPSANIKIEEVNISYN